MSRGENRKNRIFFGKQEAEERKIPENGVDRRRNTRKSVEEGLDQEFNSLDAQREAGEAYIAMENRKRLSPRTSGIGLGKFSE